MQLHSKEINIIGHKNPDTDSICSAIAYAWLKNQIEERQGGSNHYTARRAGQISSETAFVLNYFHKDVPSYINDVRSQVGDAALDESHPVSCHMSLKNAWRILNEEHLATLPVVDSQRHLTGLITLGDIAKSFMGVYGSTILSEAGTPYKNILETIDGKLLAGSADQKVDRGKVLIAAANPDLMENYIEEGDIVILGDRYESQLCAIEMNASCLIVCMDAQVSDGILKLAAEKGCAIIKRKNTKLGSVWRLWIRTEVITNDSHRTEYYLPGRRSPAAENIPVGRLAGHVVLPGGGAVDGAGAAYLHHRL